MWINLVFLAVLIALSPVSKYDEALNFVGQAKRNSLMTEQQMSPYIESFIFQKLSTGNVIIKGRSLIVQSQKEYWVIKVLEASESIEALTKEMFSDIFFTEFFPDYRFGIEGIFKLSSRNFELAKNLLKENFKKVSEQNYVYMYRLENLDYFKYLEDSSSENEFLDGLEKNLNQLRFLWEIGYVHIDYSIMVHRDKKGMSRFSVDQSYRKNGKKWEPILSREIDEEVYTPGNIEHTFVHFSNGSVKGIRDLEKLIVVQDNEEFKIEMIMHYFYQTFLYCVTNYIKRNHIIFSASYKKEDIVKSLYFHSKELLNLIKKAVKLFGLVFDLTISNQYWSEDIALSALFFLTNAHYYTQEIQSENVLCVMQKYETDATFHADHCYPDSKGYLEGHGWIQNTSARGLKVNVLKDVLSEQEYDFFRETFGLVEYEPYNTEYNPVVLIGSERTYSILSENDEERCVRMLTKKIPLPIAKKLYEKVYIMACDHSSGSHEFNALYLWDWFLTATLIKSQFNLEVLKGRVISMFDIPLMDISHDLMTTENNQLAKILLSKKKEKLHQVVFVKKSGQISQGVLKSV